MLGADGVTALQKEGSDMGVSAGRCLGMNRKTAFRVGKRGGYLDTKGRSFCLSVVKDGGIEAKIWVEVVKTGVNR